MKKVIYLCLATVFFIACQPKGPERYTQNSPEIDTVKKLIANYNAKSFDISIYVDTSKTFYNTKKNGLSPTETMDYHKQNDANYSSRGFIAEDQEYEMVLTDDGETWVNCWLDWKGTLAGNDQEVEIPVHLTYQFIDGKIVREVGMWDPTEVVMALQKIEASKTAMAEGQEE
ncbi:MAG: nuclear transport factor 2 family protein [Saonia sp.]